MHYLALPIGPYVASQLNGMYIFCDVREVVACSAHDEMYVQPGIGTNIAPGNQPQGVCCLV